jgi:hypothetical protein
MHPSSEHEAGCVDRIKICGDNMLGDSAGAASIVAAVGHADAVAAQTPAFFESTRKVVRV